MNHARSRIRQSSRLAGMQARGEEEYGPDEFDKSLLIKLNQTAKKLKDEVHAAVFTSYGG